MKNELLRIGPFTLYGYGLMIAIGVLAGWGTAEYRARKLKADAEHVFFLLLWCLLGGFLGAKILFWITEWKEIVSDPAFILWTMSDGFVVYGGILGGIFAGWLYCRVKKICFLEYFDLMIPSVALAQGFGRIGCFLAGCCYGKEAEGWLSVTFHNSDFAPNGVALVPTQIYSSILDFVHFAVLLYIARHKKADGQVFSEDNGIVTKIKISSGERVPDGASVVLADLDENFKFRTTLTREEKKYVDINDTVSLKLGNSGRTVEGQVAYLAESESTPGSYDAIVYLPPGEGAVGQSGTMMASSQSQSYPLTIPAKAVYTDNGISYVFVLRKQQGILGEELAASRVNVNVLDKNNKFASIEEGTIDADTEIIVDTTKALEEGAVVRYGSRKE